MTLDTDTGFLILVSCHYNLAEIHAPRILFTAHDAGKDVDLENSGLRLAPLCPLHQYSMMTNQAKLYRNFVCYFQHCDCNLSFNVIIYLFCIYLVCCFSAI